MPGFDRTGPQGRGPATGGGWGYCGRRGDVALGPDATRSRGRGRRFAGSYGQGYAEPAFRPQWPEGRYADILDSLRDIQRRLERLERGNDRSAVEE